MDQFLGPETDIMGEGNFMVVVVDAHIVVLDPRNLPLKFGQNPVSNSLDVPDIEFLVVVVKSHFHIKPCRCVEVRLGF